KPATLVRNVRSEQLGGAVRIVVDADGAAQFKDFVLPNPWRIVVDINGVKSAIGNKTSVVGSGLVERFRVGQPSANVVRIVLDTKSKAAYRVVREGESLVITIGDTGAAVDTKAPNASLANNTSETHKPEVRVAGDRVENKADNKAADSKDKINTSNLLAQNTQSAPPRVNPQPNRSLPLPSQPAPQPSAAK